MQMEPVPGPQPTSSIVIATVWNFNLSLSIVSCFLLPHFDIVLKLHFAVYIRVGPFGVSVCVIVETFPSGWMLLAVLTISAAFWRGWLSASCFGHLVTLLFFLLFFFLLGN